MRILSSRGLVRGVALGVALALGQSALAQDKPASEEAPAVRKQVRVKSEERVVEKETDVKDRAELEKRLEEARRRLEEAVREVADLSSQLTGPVMHNYVMTHGRSRAVLGINVGDSKSSEGVVIDSVSPNGAAEKAGLKAGDVITALDGKPMKVDKSDKEGRHAHRQDPVSKLISYMRSVTPGEKVRVEYLRDGTKRETEVVTDELKAPRFAFGVPAAPAAAAAPLAKRFELHTFPAMHDMELVTLTPKLGSYFGADKGVLVVRAPKAPELKLEEGDVIVDIDGRVPENGAHALRILRSYQPGEKVTLNVLRNRKPMKLEASVPKPEKMSWKFALPDLELDQARLEDMSKEIGDEVGLAVEIALRPSAE